jgi:hypothetical protein
MTAKIKKFALCALILALFSLSVGPVALLTSHQGHFRMSCSCSVCTAIRDDLAILRVVAAVLFLLLSLRIPVIIAQEAIPHVVIGHHPLLPVALKVRLNN